MDMIGGNQYYKINAKTFDYFGWLLLTLWERIDGRLLMSTISEIVENLEIKIHQLVKRQKESEQESSRWRTRWIPGARNATL